MFEFWVVLWMIFGPLVGYAAAERRGYSKAAGIIFGALLGPAFAWLMFFASGVTRGDSTTHKVCPYCAERIQAAAIVCKHCQRDLPTASQPTVVGGVVVDEGFQGGSGLGLK